MYLQNYQLYLDVEYKVNELILNCSAGRTQNVLGSRLSLLELSVRKAKNQKSSVVSN